MNCIFCKIIEAQIPSYKLYEDDNIIAILDISQVTMGHTLVISKKHFKNLYEIPTNEAAHIFSKLPWIANAIKKAFNPIGLNVLINTDKPLQSVFHFHIHLIPRYLDDKMDVIFPDNQSKMTKELYENIQKRINDALK